MRKIKLLLCAAALFMAGSSFLAADPLDFKNSVGVFILGNVTSETLSVKGIQYQRWCTDRWGFQTEGFVTYDAQSWQDSLPTYDFSLSGEVLLKLYETPKGYRFASTLYTWGLVGVHGFNDVVYENFPNSSTGHYVDEGFMFNTVLGLGFGFDVMMLNHISIPFQFGFEGEFPNKTSAGFCLGTGVRYKF